MTGFLILNTSTGLVAGQPLGRPGASRHHQHKVNPTWRQLAHGTRLASGVVMGLSGFASLRDAIAAANDGDVIEVSPGLYSGVHIAKSLTIQASGNGVVIQGASPALTVDSGSISLNGVSFVTATDDPTVLVNGGNLTLRNCTVTESPNFDQVGVKVTSGTADLGTAASNGGNTLIISGAGAWISNLGSGQVLAIGNTWEDNSSVITDNFQIEDGIFHALDAGGGGPVFYVADNVFVTQNSGSLQRGIDAVGAGAQVNIDAITLIEGPQIVIDKDLSVVGQGMNATTIQAGADTGTLGDARGWWLVQGCQALTLSDLTLDGHGRLLQEAIRHLGTGSISRVRFTNIQYHASGPDYAGIGIAALGACGSVSVADCEFNSIGRISLLFSGNGTVGSVTGTTCTGKGPGDWLDYAVRAEAGAHVTLQGNTITANQGVASVGGAISAGVWATTASGPATRVELSANNVITGNAIGVQAGSGSVDTSLVKLENNDLTGNTRAGLAVAGGATVDAGDCAGADVTGLGASVGGNDFTGYGFDNGVPWAIDNGNTATDPIVLAQNNLFGAGGAGAHIEDVLNDDTDAGGLSAVHASQATLTITCPPAVLVECPSDVPAAVTTLEEFAALGGAASSTPANVSAVDAPTSLTGDGTITRTYTVADANCTLSETCEQTITVDDMTPPVVSCPADLTVAADPGVCVASGVVLGVPVTSDNCGVGSVINDAPAQFPLGLTAVTWTVTDINGNVSSCTQNVTVEDTEAPSLVCAADRTVECGEDWDFQAPTATDQCDVSPVVALQSTVTNRTGFCGETFAATRTWIATDAAGNQSSCSQTVTVQDTIAPLLTCAPDKTVECGEAWDFDLPTFSDQCVFDSLIYDNSVNDQNTRFNPGTLEVGDEIVLDGTARQVTRFVFEYWGTNASQTEFAGEVKARLRFYANDGPLYHGFPTPGTVLFDSGEYAVPATPRATLEFTNFQTEALVPLTTVVPNSFTWTVQFSGLSPNDGAGLDVFSPPVIGNSFLDYWENTGSGWQLKTNTAIPAMDFAALVDASLGTITLSEISTVTNTACGNTLSATRTWEAIDACNNSAQCSQIVTVQDTTPPAIACPANLTLSTAAGVCEQTVNFNVTASDACGAVTVDCVPPSGSSFAVGTTTVTCTATDACGNESDCAFDVTIEDTELPQITCPSDIVVNNDPGLCSAVVNFVATATDNCPGANVVCTPPAGSAFPAGVTAVNCVATDAANNTAACAFNVTVTDAEPPVVTCPADMTVDTDAGQCSAVVNFAVPAADNCPGVNVMCTPPANATFAKGTTTVNCQATDAGGLTTDCHFTVTVEDTEPPALVCPGNIVTSAPPSQCDQVVEFTATATDNCPGVAVVCLPPSGSVFANGTTTVTCTATDAENLTETCAFTITVFDGEPPELTFCPPDISLECGTSLDPGHTGGAATGIDACDPAPVISHTDRAPLAVTSADLDGWTFVVQGFPVTATAELTAGPGTPPIGAGSYHAALGANGENLAEVRNFDYDQVPLSALSELSYWTYRAMDGAGGGRNIFLILNIDTDGNGSGDDVIYFEPRFQNGSNPSLPDQGAIADGTWQRWDARRGGWWSLNRPDIMGPGANVQNLATYLGVFPQAQIVNGLSGGGLRLTAGGGAGVWNDFDGNADYLVVGTNGVSLAYNFDTTDQNVCPTVVIRTWTATDLGGNATSCSQKIVQDDTTPPVLVCAADKTVECTDAWDFEAPTATDNCGSAALALVGTVTNLACGVTFEAVRTWEATDDCGNVSQCTQTVTVQDSIPPMVSCPPDVTVECGQATDPGATGSATATDNCGGTPSISFSDAATPGACPQESIITRTWTAEDECGNTSSCDQTITVVDTTPPTVTCAPPKTVECGTAWDFDLPAATDACGAVVFSVANTVTNRGCADTFTAIRTWQVADECGNAVQCAQTVTVVDTTAPLLSCVPDKTVECGSDWNFDAPAYSDECVFDSLVYDNSVHDLLVRLDVGTTEVGDEIILDGTARQLTRFVFEYWGENSTQAEFAGDVKARVRFYANDGPDFNGYPTPQTVLFDSGEFALPATPRSTVTIEDFQVDAQVPLVGDVPDSFTWSVQFSGLAANDSAGLDLFSPVVVGQNFSDYWEATGSGWQLKTNELAAVNFAARIDAARTNVLVTVVNTETNAVGACGNTFVATRTWEAVDPCGNAAQCSQVVTVADTTAPVVLCPPDLTVQCDQPSDPNATGTATAADNCGDNPSVSFSDSVGIGACPQAAVITRTWTATDACGNVGACDQVITVVDTTPPVVTCPADVTLECDASTDPSDTGSATATDNCDANPTISFADTPANGSCPQATILTRTWTATDACGNAVSCDQTITLLDTTAPVVTCPPDGTVECGTPTDPGAMGSLTATDNCDANPAVSFSDVSEPGACPQESIITRTWTATDGCGNASSCVQIITVKDTTPPVVTCPADVTVECGDPTNPGTTGTASATDNCDTAPVITSSDALAAGGCPEEQTITRTWTATDACGNTASCDQTITIVDSTPPVMVCPGNITTNITEGPCEQVVEFAVTATDNCGATTIACTPPSGSAFPKGTTVVTCTASDACGNTADCTFEVVVEPLVFSQTVNAVIPDDDAGGLTNTMTINTAITQITDLEVGLRISHNWNGDLHAYLVHASGFAVLLNRVGRRSTGAQGPLGYSDDGFDVVLDDEAAHGDVHVYRLTLFGDHESTLSGPLTGVWAPDGRNTDPTQTLDTDARTELLSSFQGLDPNGDWTLVVADLQSGDTGTLESWSLRMCGDVGVPPEISSQPQDITVECGTPAVFSVAATGTEPLAYQWYFASNPLAGETGATLTIPNAQPGNAGGYTVMITNDLGTVTSQVATLTVEDTQPPQIMCPADMIVSTDPGLCEATVNNFGISANDTCGAVTVVCSPPAGTAFAKGVTTVNCTATDDANNTASCSFTVTVEDQELPLITCPADMTVGTDAGQCSATATFAPTVSDNCPGVVAVCVPASGSVFAEGTTVVNCTATDASGNTADCAFNVTVQDTERPEVCQDPPVQLLAGDVDDFVGAEPSSPSANLQAYVSGLSAALRDFDDATGDRWLAQSFSGLPADLSSARLQVKLAATSAAALDDTIRIVFSQPGGALRPEQWTRTIGLDQAVPGLLGTTAWTAGEVAELELDLSRLPNADGTTTDLLTVMRQEGAVDVLVENDTEVDFLSLKIETCQCSTTIELDKDPGQCGAVVFYPPPFFFDNCDPNPTVVCVPAAGSLFPLGTTVVQCSATDASGNVGQCSFAVSINEPAPVLQFMRSGTDLILTWEITCFDYVLEETSSLDLPIVWTPAGVPVTTVGSQFQAVIPINSPQKYFRLRKAIP